LCFPSLIAGFAGTVFARSKDSELGLACLRAWNDWHREEWAGPHPDRIIALQLAWLDEPEVAAADVRANAERGFKAVSFPENPVAFSEGGIGWVPMLIDRVDYVLDHSAVGLAAWKDAELSPVETLRRNFWFCTIDIPTTFALRDHIGVDRIMLESDYPHADSTWPDTQVRARKGLAGLSPQEVRMVTWENASRLFRHPV